jgi:hypothetical protein
MRTVKRLNDRDGHQLTDDCQAPQPKKVAEINAACVRYPVHRSKFHLTFQISLMAQVGALTHHHQLTRTWRPGRILK